MSRSKTSLTGIHNYAVAGIGSAAGPWIDLGITKARVINDCGGHVPRGTVGTITKRLGFGRVEFTLEDGTKYRPEMRCLLLMRDE